MRLPHIKNMSKSQKQELLAKYHEYCEQLVTDKLTPEEEHSLIKKVSNVYSSHIKHMKTD